MHVGDFFGQTNASCSFVTGSTGSVPLLYSNMGSKKICFFNHANSSMFLKFGNGASVTSFTVKVGSGSYYETPLPVHTGSYTATWDASGGFVMITHL